ncbi:MAG: carbamate kinase [Candidatus Hydrothermales bacterium]
MKIVIALGGNAILPKGKSPDIVTQFENTEKTLRKLVPVLKRSKSAFITHGNGPQVGIELLRSFYAREVTPPYPLDILGAETQGWMGYMIVHILKEIFWEEKVEKEAVAIVTQVLVSPDDPEFKDPSKPIGPFFTKEEAESLMTKFPWPIKEDSGRGYRITVPSPEPIDILEKDVLKELSKEGVVTVAVGGGGIPVVREGNKLKARLAVIDKDRASSLLARLISADLFMILTDVDFVYLNFKKENQKELRKIKVSKLKEHILEGHFSRGSMLPKVEASISFVLETGKRAVITSLERCIEGLEGNWGTQIIPD